MSDRAALEARATELGLPWTHDTPDTDLATLIEKAEQSGSLQAIETEPPCIGLHWDPIFEEQCKTCNHKDPCKERFVRQRVPECLAEFEDDHDMCADESGISDAAWQVCFLAHLEIQKAEAAADNGEQAPQEPEKPKKKPPKRKPKEQLEMGKPPEEEPAEVRPTQAGSADTAADPAKSNPKRKPRKRAAKSRAPLAQEPVGEWSLQTHADRHRREREKNPLIGQLVPGMVLRRKYKGTLWELEVMEEGYLLRRDGRIYPTLYMTVKAIVGTVRVRKQKKPHHKTQPEGYREMVPYSGPGFWNLKGQLRQLLLDAASDSTSPEEK